ncbi:TRAP transporter substrate-binding protein [Thalassospira povalilytica]|uniref:TRAP transporter substrate-binding protein n=1 Tax=Thalassospira povalilytica TaxID=732237 RepID=UPI003AA7CA7C
MKKMLGLMLGATVAFSPLIANAADIEIRVAHGSSPQFHMHKALERFAEIIEERSNNRIDVQIFPSGQIAGDTGMVEAVLAGSVEMAVEPPSFFAKWDEAFEVAELPFIYPNKDVAFKVLNSEAGDALMARLKDLDLVGLGWMEMGQRVLTNNTRPISSPEDMDGIKLRTMKVPTHIAAFKALGANPTPMNFGEVYAALQVGVIDGQENPISQIYTQKFQEVQKYMTLTNHVLALYLPVMNAEFYNDLSEDDQNLLREAMKEAISYDFELIDSENNDYLEEIKADGVQVTTLTPEQKLKFVKAMEPIASEFRERVGTEIYDLWMAKIAEFSTS